MHAALYHGQSLLNGLKRMKVEPDDIHTKLMRNYSEVAEWWYVGATVLAAFIQVGVKQWIFAHVADICQPNQISQLTCPHT